MNLSKFLYSLHPVLTESRLTFAVHTKSFPSCGFYHFRPAVLVFTSENIQNIDHILFISKEKHMPLELICVFFKVTANPIALKDFFLFGKILLKTYKA